MRYFMHTYWLHSGIPEYKKHLSPEGSPTSHGRTCLSIVPSISKNFPVVLVPACVWIDFLISGNTASRGVRRGCVRGSVQFQASSAELCMDRSILRHFTGRAVHIPAPRTDCQQSTLRPAFIERETFPARL